MGYYSVGINKSTIIESLFLFCIHNTKLWFWKIIKSPLKDPVSNAEILEVRDKLWVDILLNYTFLNRINTQWVWIMSTAIQKFKEFHEKLCKHKILHNFKDIAKVLFLELSLFFHSTVNYTNTSAHNITVSLLCINVY